MKSIRFTLAIFAMSLAGAASAHAGKALTSGPIPFDAGDNLICVAVNVSSKDVSDIAVSIFKGEAGSSEVGTTCATELPNGVCGVSSTLGSPGYRYCSLTLGGSTKAVRARLCNTTTGDCSELR